MNDKELPVIESLGGKTPWEFACAWYTADQIQRCLDRQRRLLDHPLHPTPTDIYSREFAEWMADQYRLAMRKGIEIGQRSTEPLAPSSQAASDKLDSSGWQPMESAPKDGTVLWGWLKLAGGPDRYHQDTFAWFESKHHEGGGWWVSHALAVEPKFWMPLPAPPQEQE
jgi:hypothetical protein